MRQSLRVLAAMLMDLAKELKRLDSLQTTGEEVAKVSQLPFISSRLKTGQIEDVYKNIEERAKRKKKDGPSQ
ncbi:unnamed protein product [Haemonchus placei]|uniref:HAUS augmin-like complex subunit 1 n=1 Tax=Haemonchus placei TaxID=6290 RepID=A0A0N4WP90_HAEPC|nr:unnamed protein product [Haemonchus placei]